MGDAVADRADPGLHCVRFAPFCKLMGENLRLWIGM